jgi:hypothetical protein
MDFNTLYCKCSYQAVELPGAQKWFMLFDVKVLDYEMSFEVCILVFTLYNSTKTWVTDVVFIVAPRIRRDNVHSQDAPKGKEKWTSL